MKTIVNNSVNEIIVKNSRFITCLYKLNSNSDISSILSSVKELYPKATHYCYAYILGDYKKSSDDFEPSGTAGMPMLNVLEKEGIINVLAVTVRYFGGIKLGAGGLVRSYSKSVRDALLNTLTVDVEDGYLVELTFKYEDERNINYLLRNYKIIDKEFNLNIKYKVLIPISNINILDNYQYKILSNEYIEKASQ